MNLKKFIQRFLGFLFWSFIGFLMIGAGWRPTWANRPDLEEVVVNFFVQKTLSIPNWWWLLMCWYAVLLVLIIPTLKETDSKPEAEKGGVNER